jgi:hypothetical protein
MTVKSFTAICENCQGMLTPGMIEAEITEWGAHIIVIRGVGNCFRCGHQSGVQIKIRDDGSVYDEKRGIWISPDKGLYGMLVKPISSLMSRESLIVLTCFIFSWLVVVSAGSSFRVPVRIICHKGTMYSVTGDGKEKGTCRAFPVGGNNQLEIPKQRNRAI